MKLRWVWPIALAVFASLAFASAALASTSGRGGTMSAQRALAASATTGHVSGRQLSPQDVLYSQYDNPGTSSVASQQFPDFGNADIDLADDFTDRKSTRLTSSHVS